MTYHTVNRDGLYDFRNLILPDIYEQLVQIDDFDERGITVIGAVSGNHPVGAAVMAFLDEPSISILSLYVLPKARNHGVGSRLIHYVLKAALDYFAFPSGIPQVFARLEYVLPEKSAIRFEKFLSKNNFRKIIPMGRAFILNGETALSKLTEIKAEIHLLSEIAGEDTDIVAAEMQNAGIDGEPSYSCIAGNTEDPDMIMETEYGSGNTFYIYSRLLTEKSSEDTYKSMIFRVITEIRKDYPDCVLIADEGKNEYPEVWKNVAESVSNHAEAVLAAVFDR